MDDQRKHAQAWAMFSAFANNLPGEISEQRVEDYHRILQELSDASGEDLAAFKIPDRELEKKVTGIRLARGRRPGATYYSDERYCDSAAMRRQIEAVLHYFQAIQPPPPGVGFRPQRLYGHRRHDRNPRHQRDCKINNLRIVSTR